MREVYENCQDATQTAAILNGFGWSNRGKNWTKAAIVKCLGSLTNNTFSKDLLSALE